MPRFVVLFHDCTPHLGTPSHWDLMLERDGALMTWRLAELPAVWRRSKDASNREAPEQFTAARLPDHRLAYLVYEGPVSGDRGHVTRYDHGEYQVVSESSDSLVVQLVGTAIQAQITLPTAPPQTGHDARRG